MGALFEWLAGGTIALMIIGLVAWYVWHRLMRRSRKPGRARTDLRDPMNDFGEPVRARDMRATDIQRVIQLGLNDVIRPD